MRRLARFILSLTVGICLLVALILSAAQGWRLAGAEVPWIAYSRFVGCFAPPCEQQIVVLNPHELYDSRILEIPPQPNIDSITWSPGRDQLAFSSISQIGFYDLRHHLRAQPLHAPSFVFYREVDWSGSGRYLAYVAYDMLARELPDNTAYVHLYDTRQQAITQVAIQRVHFERGIAPQWMRDDDRLVLAIPNYDHRTADGLPLALTELAWLDVSSQVITPVAPQRIIGSSPALSADDTQVAYVGLTAIDEVPQIGVLRVGLEMPPAMLSQSDGYKVAPRWVFDNRAIVFDDYDSVNIHSNLTLRWLDRDETIVLPTLRVVYDFDVSPDQRWIAYLGTDRVQSLAVCVMSLETQEQRCRFDAAIKQGSRIAWAR